MNRLAVWVVLAFVCFGVVLGATFYSRAVAIHDNCEAINRNRATLVTIMQRSRALKFRVAPAAGRARFYRRSIRSLGPIPCD